MARQKRSVEELQRASLAVQYEAMTLFACHEMLQDSQTNRASGGREKAVSNALLHSMLLAARNLLAFLYSYKPRETDIIAEDFFDDPNAWQANRLVPSPEMADGTLIGQISKQLAHLTWERADEKKPLWGAFRIVWSIVLALESLLNFVAVERIHKALRTDVGLMKVALQRVLNQHPEWAGLMAPSLESIKFDSVAYFGT